jgi:FkbM family methyltransferase
MTEEKDQRYAGHPDQHFGQITYSQHGEDIMLLNLFRLLGIEHPTYLDLGANHPIHISNTYKMYCRGFRGVAVEASWVVADEYKRVRPEDKMICVGIVPHTDGAELRDFYKYSETSGRNTLSLKETETLSGVMTVNSIMKVPVVTLDTLVEEHCDGAFPDFLSCDIEGLDFDVLKSSVLLEMEPPKIVCVETRRQSTEEMIDMMYGKGFDVYCRMGENLIFVHQRLIDLVY